MKKITIIGAGITGLRAAWELIQDGDFQVTMVDKAMSVGGRVATRRFEHGHVNHGALTFDHLDQVRMIDPLIERWGIQQKLPTAATDLPKLIRDQLTKIDRFSLKTNWQAQSVKDGVVTSTQGETLFSDAVIVTAPTPQIEAMCGVKIPQVQYSKCILFIGVLEKSPVRIEMDAEWSEKHFDMKDEAITLAGQTLLGHELNNLMVKKWRYARVVTGIAQDFISLDQKTFVAGDAFDPRGEYGLAASWLSGFKIGRHITEDFNG